MKLIDVRTSDGSRHFACLPRTVTWQALCKHRELLPGTEAGSLAINALGIAWLDFTYRGHRFLIRQRADQFHFFVCDPRCPDLSVYQVAAHFEKLLAGNGK